MNDFKAESQYPTIGTLQNMSDTTYRGRDGATLTALQVEQEFRKARIVAGQPTTGPEYAAALKEWKGTYTVVSAREKKASSASVMTLFVGIGITAVLAIMAGFGGGIFAFILVGVLGGFASAGLAAFVMLFSVPSGTPKPDSSAGLPKDLLR